MGSGGETFPFRGKSGLLYLMTMYPWRHPLPEGPGVYVVTALETVAGTATRRIIYVGEAEDLASALSNHPRRGCFAQHARKRKWACPNPFRRWRLAVVDDLVAANRPPCNRPG